MHCTASYVANQTLRTARGGRIDRVEGTVNLSLQPCRSSSSKVDFYYDMAATRSVALLLSSTKLLTREIAQVSKQLSR